MSLITQILTGVWLVSPEYKQGFSPIVARIINGGNLSFSEVRQYVKEREERYSAVLSGVPSETGYYGYGFSNSTEDRVGIIKINGIMIKDTDASTYGTDEVYELLKSAGENPNIVSVLMMVNSGGGYSDSAYNISDMIGSFPERFGKPVFSLVDNQAASGGYWAISKSEKIFLNGKSASVGSIGVYGTIYNLTKMLEMQGIEEITVYADGSEDKNKAYKEAIAGNVEPYREILNIIRRDFKSTVKQGRPNVSEDAFGGLMYFGNEAIKVGLADGILNKEDALDYAFRVGMKRKKKKY